MASLALRHGRIHPTETVLLALPQPSRRLHHVNGINGPGQVRKAPNRPQHILHQRPPSGPNLDQVHPFPHLALRYPLGNEPDAHQLAENLRDLGRRDKVASLAKLVRLGRRGGRGGVVGARVGGKTHAHVGCQGDGTGCLGMLVLGFWF